MMKKYDKQKTILLISILIPLAAGLLSSLLSGGMAQMYPSFEKPSFAPPGILFPIVWTILYTLMGISSYLIYQSRNPAKREALFVYFLQLFFNFFWSILFFRFSFYLIAFCWLTALIVLILCMILAFSKISQKAAYLQLPYLFWCIFAAVLNFAIYRLN